MRILHLSDIHYNESEVQDIRQFILNPLIKDLKTMHGTKKIDLIVVTGDIIDKGGNGNSNKDNIFKQAFETTIDCILKELGLKKDIVFFAPGNHDVFRLNDSEIVESGLSQKLCTIQKVNEFIDKTGSEEGIKRILPFKEFEKEYYSDYKEKELSNFHSLFKINIDNNKIGIACLNSAWRSYDSSLDRLNLIIGERQLCASDSYFNDTKANIAIMHHPIDWLKEFDRQSIEPFIFRQFKIILCGHIHSGSSWQATNIYGGLFVSSAPSNWVYNSRNTNGKNNGYSIIDFDVNTGEISVFNRKHVYTKNCYIADNELGDENGIVKYKLPSSNEVALYQQAKDIMGAIKSDHYDEINEHLLSYNSETRAPKEIKSIFVMPKIVEKIDIKSEKHNEKVVSFDDLCECCDNQIIIGLKESGKTILLDRLLLHYTDNFDNLKTIPVFIDFNDIGSKKIETMMARYLCMGLSCFKDILKNQNILLLIDNITFGEEHKHTLKTVESFVKTNKNVKLLGTMTSMVEGGLPMDLLEYPFYTNMKKLYIKSMGSKEIRTLIQKWFSKNDDDDDKTEKLIRTLTGLNLPRTPLATSMFLWIIEQQENYQPINQATMLENFIEKLFSKHSRKEIHSDQFDYRNKERLLSGIAYYMYNKNMINYRTTYRELLDYSDDYLKNKKFEFIKAADVLDHFIEKGIFIKETDEGNEFVRFRFSCFLHYFLMKKMLFDKDFLKYVLDESRFLTFTHEIDYFTGIKRDSDDILRLIIERLNKEFKPLIDFINGLPNTYDNIFEPRTSFVKSVGNDFMGRIIGQKKPTQNEIDEITDKALETITPEKDIKRKETSISSKVKMERLWSLAASVLKNTEETDVENIKYESYVSVLHSSMAYANYWKYSIEKYVFDHSKEQDFKLDSEIDMQRKVVPILHQLTLFALLGTKKLSMVIREKLDNDTKDESISDFEKFASVFIYADIRGTNANKYINQLVKTIKNPHLVDMTLFKLLSYYYFRSKTKDTDKIYENLIADLIVNARGGAKNQKTKIISNYRKLKRIKKTEPQDED